MVSQSTQPPAILIVEDEPDILIILRSLLRELTGGFEIVTTTNGTDALARVRQGGVVLVFTDYNMPGMNGLELITAIRAEAPKTKIVMITAYASLELEQQARECGAHDFLPKPFSLERLMQIIRTMLTG